MTGITQEKIIDKMEIRASSDRKDDNSGCEYCRMTRGGNSPLAQGYLDFGNLGDFPVELEIAYWVSGQGMAHDPCLVLTIDRPYNKEDILLTFGRIHYCPMCGRNLD